ncbi:hypothetical protein M8J77_016644 [Diaphorina citri]|nr:hypothetical protein M8J77_016644 [Diaphorina citri]
MGLVARLKARRTCCLRQTPVPTPTLLNFSDPMAGAIAACSPNPKSPVLAHNRNISTNTSGSTGISTNTNGNTDISTNTNGSTDISTNTNGSTGISTNTNGSTEMIGR